MTARLSDCGSCVTGSPLSSCVFFRPIMFFHVQQKANLLPLATMFGTSLLEDCRVKCDLRNLMAVVGAPLQGYSPPRVMITLATSLYAESEDRNAAVYLV